MRHLEVDWNKFVSWLLPSSIKSGILWSWLKALVSPVILLHAQLLALAIVQERDIRTNGQTTKLRARLNYEIDSVLERIEIHDVLDKDFIFAYLASENKPVYLPQFLSAGNGFDFEVWIPEHYKNQINYITSLLDRYKLPTMKYYIIWI